jgi:putative membrane protein
MSQGSLTSHTNEANAKNTGLRSQGLPSVFLRGIAMGAADIVPGISGGTIAFITGIYFRLLAAINALPKALLTDLIRGRVAVFWQVCDGSFLLTLLGGIVLSIATMASAISYLLTTYPILLWSFFFGLILASVWHVGREVRQYHWRLVLPLLVGTAFAWWITSLPAMATEPSAPMFLFAGAIAICAMILPGISGSFILVIMGMYLPVLSAIKSFDVALLLLFVGGCAAGLFSIARLITWAFDRFHDGVLALLIGFMLGALNKVWPWKETLSWRVNSAGEQVPVHEASISPALFAELTGLNPLVFQALLMAVAGILLVLVVEWLGLRFAGRKRS